MSASESLSLTWPMKFMIATMVFGQIWHKATTGRQHCLASNGLCMLYSWRSVMALAQVTLSELVHITDIA